MVALKEQDLLAKLQDPGMKATAFHQLVITYQQMLYFHIRRIVIDHEDTDDVLQNTLLKAWKYIDQFRAQSSIKTWLYRIATNEALTFLSKKKKASFQDLNDIQNDLRHSLSEEKYFDGDEIQLKLQQAILSLPERQRLVFNMRYYDELKYDEIADILSVSTGALKASYHHAVRKIEEYLKTQS